MFVRVLKSTCAALCCVAILSTTGCCCQKKTRVAKRPCGAPCPKTVEPVVTQGPCERPAGEVAAELPPNAMPGECYAKVWIPPTFRTVTERVLVKEASERIEVIPARYEWVEERVCVKDASTRLVEVPAEYGDRDVTVQTASAHTDWEVNKVPCEPPADAQTKDVFCLVTHPAEQQTIRTQRVMKPAHVVQEQIPAQFETVRRERLMSPSSTRRIGIPAEYQTVERQVKVCDGRMAWRRVDCNVPGATRAGASATHSRTETHPYAGRALAAAHD